MLGLGAGLLVEVVAGLGGPVGLTVDGLSVSVMTTVGLAVVVPVVAVVGLGLDVVLLVVVVVGLAVVLLVVVGLAVVVVGLGAGGAGGNTGEGGGEGGPANTTTPSSSNSSSSSATTAEIWGMEAPPSAGGTGIRSATPKFPRTGSEFLCWYPWCPLLPLRPHSRSHSRHSGGVDTQRPVAVQ